MATILDLKATSESSFNIGIASDAIKLKNASGVLHLRNKADSSYIDLAVRDISVVAGYFDQLNVTGEFLTLNSDAAGSGSDWLMTLRRPTAGMSANVDYTFPATPTNGYFLTTDASGNMSWAAVSSPSVTEKVTVDSTSFNAASFSGPLAMFTLPAQAIIHRVEIIVDTAFDDVPSVQVTGFTLGSIMGSGQSDLTDASRFVAEPNFTALVGTEAISASFVGTPTVGAGRILVHYSIPA